jgi:hypothetical protein
MDVDPRGRDWDGPAVTTSRRTGIALNDPRATMAPVRPAAPAELTDGGGVAMIGE